MPISVGICHPGTMGVTVGKAAAGHARVLWASAGRSRATLERARRAGLLELDSLAAVAGEADVLVSVLPPHAALEAASAVAGLDFTGIYLDANAVSPRETQRIAEIIQSAGGRFVDGGIVGPPAVTPGTTRLYLSGPNARDVAAIFEGSALEPIVLDDRIGTASTFKICYAAYNKGSIALLLLIRALADAEDIDHALMNEWALSQPGVQERSERLGRVFAPRAWRFVGEMIEIAETFEARGLPGGFHRCAAEIYETLADFRGADELPEFDAVLKRLQ